MTAPFNSFNPSTSIYRTTFTIQRLPSKRDFKRRTHWTSLVLHSNLKREDVSRLTICRLDEPDIEVYAVTPSPRRGFDAERQIVADLLYFSPAIIESDRLQQMFESLAWKAFNGDLLEALSAVEELAQYGLSAHRKDGKVYAALQTDASRDRWEKISTAREEQVR